MRSFSLLADVELRMLDGDFVPDSKESERSLSHVKFLLQRLTDPKATATFEHLCKALKVRDALVTAKGKNAAARLRVELEDADWEFLCVVLREPTGGYGVLGHCVVGFVREVLDAKEPVKKDA